MRAGDLRSCVLKAFLCGNRWSSAFAERCFLVGSKYICQSAGYCYFWRDALFCPQYWSLTYLPRAHFLHSLAAGKSFPSFSTVSQKRSVYCRKKISGSTFWLKVLLPKGRLQQESSQRRAAIHAHDLSCLLVLSIDTKLCCVVVVLQAGELSKMRMSEYILLSPSHISLSHGEGERERKERWRWELLSTFTQDEAEAAPFPRPPYLLRSLHGRPQERASEDAKNVRTNVRTHSRTDLLTAPLL